MTFLVAGWLALLLPWAALVAWAWRRVADEHATTAAFLWTSKLDEVPRSKSRRGRPAAWVIAALVAMLAAIVALAGPTYHARRARVAVVVDGSVALAAKHDGITLRESLRRECVQAFAHARVVPEFEVNIAGLAASTSYSLANLESAPFTAKPTVQSVDAAVNVGLREADAVIVLCDRAIDRRDDRMAQLAPAVVSDNVGIEFTVACEQPRPSVMVRIANDSDRREATLEIRTLNSVAQAFLPVVGGADASSQAGMPVPPTIQQSLALPPRGERKDYFIDLASPGDVVEITLAGLNDALPIDDTATLLRSHRSPRLAVDADAPEVASRFASAFERANRSTTNDGSTPIIGLGSSPSSASIPSRGEIVVARADGAPKATNLNVTDHPILRDIDLSAPTIDRIATPPPADWTTIASIGGDPILAVRQSPVRSIWIGFDLDPNEARSVILLANAVDWITGASPAEWRGESPEAIGADWKPISLVDPKLEGSPGVYTDGDGREVAINVPAIVGPHAASQGDVGDLLRRADRATRVDLRRLFAIVAALCASMAALLSARRRVP